MSNPELTAAQLREDAFVRAHNNGHTLGTWREIDGGEVYAAHCRRCFATAIVDVYHAPHVCGPATSSRCARPDPFLANQHESVTRGLR